MNAMQVASLVLVAVGVFLILIGGYISLKEWEKKQRFQQGLKDALEGLTKLADALKGYPLGQQLIVWGIFVLIIAGLFGGLSGFA
jgi:hypothetical protein